MKPFGTTAADISKWGSHALQASEQSSTTNLGRLDPGSGPEARHRAMLSSTANKYIGVLLKSLSFVLGAVELSL
jgi:hypothetical protein